ncbi:unnamed protein product [Rotaria sordida]|uniref:Intersectin-1 n=1 Tax=Rotaria sordida TaxID=392033 RepID=A0A813YCK5_9BILA|nr:unnamed protein product [Rotaria sordida]
MAGDWRISAEERKQYDLYFQQCNPIQGYVSGDQARNFFLKSSLSADILRKIWNLSDITADGRLDKREFTIACHLISSQVQKKVPLPDKLPPTLLSDAILITANGAPPPSSMSTLSLSIVRPVQSWSAPGQSLVSAQPLIPVLIPPAPLTPAVRSKYLQQFHSLVDVTKTNGFMSGLQARNILQQTGLSQTVLHQIWALADHDKDGRLTSDEFVIAMHCCDVVRAGQILPTRLPDEWLNTTIVQRERIGSLGTSNVSSAFANINQELKDAFKFPTTTENHAPETIEPERRNSLVSYEEKRQKNYEDGFKELERRRQLLREQEERDQREREERERKREFELQKQKDEQERRKQMEFERQLERQRQIEHQKEEERRKLFEQREAARKDMERKSRLEWERQRMQELSTQKSRLLEQTNNLKSREKALELELQSMDDTIQTNQKKVHQTNTNIQIIDQKINDMQKHTIQEKHLLENFEQQRKDLYIKLNYLQTERESINSSLKNLNQSKEFSMANRESDQMKFLQLQLDNVKQESIHVDEQITTMNHQCKQYQNQMEQLRRQLNQLEQDAKNKKPINKVTLQTTTTTTSLPYYDRFNTTNDFNAQSYSIPPVASISTAIDVDPFQTVDPFASQSDIGSPTTITNHDWFQSSNNGQIKNDPFISKTEISPKPKKIAPKVNIKQISTIDPWGSSTTNNPGNDWTSTNKNNNINSSFGITNEWSQSSSTISNGNSSSSTIQYRALYDYIPQRSDELAMSVGDIIIIDPTQKQQDENWLFGKIGNDKYGFFPAAYVERLPSTSVSTNGNTVDTTSQLISGSWVITLADCQGKTVDKHLSFQKGELILVREQKDAAWYSGQLRGKVGWFPRNYVRPATEIEIQNNKNTTKTTPTNEKPLNSPMSPTSASSTDSSFADIYEAIYPYEATDPSDLSFNAGERIIVLKREGDWWTGKVGDRTGTFPNNYVQKVETPLLETAIAIAPFQTQDEGRLPFGIGQLIYIRKKGDKGWYQGEIRSTDQPIRVGWFPANCVQIQTQSAPAPPPAPASVSSTPLYLNASESPRYIALFAYDAQHEDELSFPADAILEILDQSGNNGWFKARYNNQIGLIPSTYVKPIDEHTSSSSTESRLLPQIPATVNSSQHVVINNSTMKTRSSDGDTSIQNLSNNSLRISAIRELIETEQRYVDDLLIVTNQFIEPLYNARILNDYEIEQLFINWYNLITLNNNHLKALHEQVDYTEDINSTENEVITRPPRSVSMSNIALAAQFSSKSTIDIHHRSFTPDVSHSPSIRLVKNRNVTHHRSPSINNIVVKPNTDYMNDNIIPPTPLLSTGLMTITESTKIGEILCSHLPNMANDYFQYCNSRSQANKSLQIKIDSNENFRSYLKIFQDNTGGLSLNGFLTKPIQRVTRYPLLIEKILKHTLINHPDYESLKQALDCARQLNERINKQISEQESSLRLDWLQQHLIFGSDENSSDGYLLDELVKFNSLNKYNIQRKLILHGLVTKVPSGKELLAFLFNDFLLCSTIKSSSSSTNWQTQIFEQKSTLQLKLYRLPLFLIDIIIANESLNDQLTFSITSKVHEKPLVLKAQQTNVRTLWVKSINNAVEECQAAEKSILADKAMFTIPGNKHNSRAAVARLLLVVQEAQDLMPSNKTLERHRSVDPYCEITVCSLTLKTPFIKRTINPKWNAPMQFLIYNLKEDMIHINIFDNEYFSPNESLGYISVHLTDILPCPLDTFLTKPSLPFTQKVYLNNGSSVIIKCVVQILTTSN